jgi:hypothetical protein
MANGITSEIGGGVDLRAMRMLARGDDIFIGHIGGLMHPQKKGGKAVENATLAQWLHDGTASIPARPYLRQGIREGWVAIQKMMSAYLKEKIRNPTKADPKKIGAVAVGAVKELVQGQAYYREHIPNAPSTIKGKKGKDNPLIDTGFLINSITFVARNGPEPKNFPTTNAVEAKD